MKESRTVVLYGNSLIVSSIGASLQDHVGLQLVQINAVSPVAAERLDALTPDLVIFDLATVHPDLSIALMSKHPGLVLIGVDLQSGKMLLLTGHQSQIMTTDDMVRVIDSFCGVPNQSVRRIE